MSDIFRNNNAKAIWIDSEKQPNRYVKFQTEFEADGKEVLFYISADTQYELYINGKFAGFGQYGDYPDKKVYDCIDVSHLVKEGKNLVSILAFSNGVHSLSHYSGLPMVIFAVTENGKCVLKSDENVKCCDDTEFTSGEFENITNQLSYNFGFDLRKDDFYREKLVSETWKNAVILDDSSVKYTSRPLKKTVLKDVCEGEIITQGEFRLSDGDTVAEKMQNAFFAMRLEKDVFDREDGSLIPKKDNLYWIVDMGEEIAGHIVLDIEAEDGAILDIAYGEHLKDMRVRSSVGGRNFAFRTVCREGRQQIAFYIRRLAGRYLEVFSHSGIKKVHTIALHRVEYPLNYNELTLNDGLYNKIYEASQRTLMLCMHEHYEDCPWREQALYGMDSRNQMLAGYYAFGETDMPRESLRLLADSQRESGLLELTAPSEFHKTIPTFSLAWINSVSEYILFSGDKDFGKEMLPAAKRIIEFFKIDPDKNLVITPTESECWHLYEWNAGMTIWDLYGRLRYDAPLNAYYVLTLRKYQQICEAINNKEETAWAQKLIDTICGSFHNAFYSEENKAYTTYLSGGKPSVKVEKTGEGMYYDGDEDSERDVFAQLTQAWALCGGCVPKEYQDIIRASIVRDDLIECTISHSVYKYDALMQDAEKYAGIVLSEISDKWGYMLYDGATTFWETILGDKDFDRAGSLCHGWSATPAYIFWRYIMGVYPEAPGFEKIEVNPCCGDSFKAEGILKTQKGTYKATHKNGKTEINLI